MSGKASSNGHHSTDDRAFTLLEILVAIFIFGIVVSTIFGSFHAVFSQTAAISSDSALYEMGRNCMNRMVLDLQSIHVALPPQYDEPESEDELDPYRFVSEIKAVEESEFSHLRFASRAHLSFAQPPQTGIAAVVYYVQKDEADEFLIRRSDDLYPFNEFEPSSMDPILCNHLKSLHFTFYDAEGIDYEDWNSEDQNFEYATPQSIKIALVIGNEDNDHRFETLVSLPVYRSKKED